MVRFIWTRKNVEHIAEHGITPEEAEYVVTFGRTIPHGDAKFLARGRTRDGRYVQVIYVLESDAAELDYAELDLLAVEETADGVVVIHARPLTEAEKSALRGRKRNKRKRR